MNAPLAMQVVRLLLIEVERDWMCKPSCKAENTSRFYAEEPACEKFHTMLSLVDERQRSATASAVGSTFITFIDEVFY